jgi:hypothetical protein
MYRTVFYLKQDGCFQRLVSVSIFRWELPGPEIEAGSHNRTCNVDFGMTVW